MTLTLTAVEDISLALTGDHYTIVNIILLSETYLTINVNSTFIEQFFVSVIEHRIADS